MGIFRHDTITHGIDTWRQIANRGMDIRAIGQALFDIVIVDTLAFTIDHRQRLVLASDWIVEPQIDLLGRLGDGFILRRLRFHQNGMRLGSKGNH